MSIELIVLEFDSIDVLLDAIIFTLAHAPSTSVDGEIAINETDYIELERIRNILLETF